MRQLVQEIHAVDAKGASHHICDHRLPLCSDRCYTSRYGLSTFNVNEPVDDIHSRNPDCSLDFAAVISSPCQDHFAGYLRG